MTIDAYGYTVESGYAKSKVRWHAIHEPIIHRDGLVLQFSNLQWIFVPFDRLPDDVTTQDLIESITFWRGDA